MMAGKITAPYLISSIILVQRKIQLTDTAAPFDAMPQAVNEWFARFISSYIQM